jgi:hypothetical protein
MSGDDAEEDGKSNAGMVIVGAVGGDGNGGSREVSVSSSSSAHRHHQRVRNKWQLAYSLVNNPSLIPLRRSRGKQPQPGGGETKDGAATGSKRNMVLGPGSSSDTANAAQHGAVGSFIDSMLCIAMVNKE